MNADVTSIQLPCALAQNRRAMRLDFGPAATAAAQTLVPQYADIHQGICAGLEAQVVCLSERADLSRDEPARAARIDPGGDG